MRRMDDDKRLYDKITNILLPWLFEVGECTVYKIDA